MEKITLMLAEDHVLFRETLVSYLNQIEDFEVIGHAGNGSDLWKLILKNQPMVVITDLQTPLMNGFELSAKIKDEYPDVKIIYLSMFYSAAFASEMITNGINSCLPKECSPDILAEAIRDVVKRGFYFNPGFNNLVIVNKEIESVKSQLALSAREIEVLKLICDGKTNKEISEALFLSIPTIDFHRQNIYKKTKISSVALLVKYAIQNGIITVS